MLEIQEPEFHQNFIQDLLHHRVLANCEGDRYSSPTDIGIDGKTLLFEINDLLVDTSQAVKFSNTETQPSNLYSKRVMKMV